MDCPRSSKQWWALLWEICITPSLWFCKAIRWETEGLLNITSVCLCQDGCIRWGYDLWICERKLSKYKTYLFWLKRSALQKWNNIHFLMGQQSIGTFVYVFVWHNSIIQNFSRISKVQEPHGVAELGWDTIGDRTVLFSIVFLVSQVFHSCCYFHVWLKDISCLSRYFSMPKGSGGATGWKRCQEAPRCYPNVQFIMFLVLHEMRKEDPFLQIKFYWNKAIHIYFCIVCISVP